jgi:hypothetical protein
MIDVTDQRTLEQAEILLDAFVQYRTRYGPLRTFVYGRSLGGNRQAGERW